MTIDLDLLPTPPMGFNTWNRFGMNINEGLIRETLAKMVDMGLVRLGYHYVNIDDGWMAPERDRRGRLRPDPVRFPHGILPLAEEAHQAGMKLGLYLDAGHQTCGGLPGSYGHERDDAELLASWGIDYVKHDWCHVPFEDFPGRSHRDVAEILYGRMSEALAATGHPLVLSMCNWGDGEPWEWARGMAHLWRTTGDIADCYQGRPQAWTQGMVEVFRQNAALHAYAGPGGFNDPDMLEVGNGGMTATEYRTHFALWCLMAAPLLIGTDVRVLSDEARRILTNQDLIAVNQDPLGQQARLLSHGGPVHFLVKPLTGNTVAVGLFNESDWEEHPLVTWEGLPGTSGARFWAKDLFTGEERMVRGSERIPVEAHDTRVWTLRPAD